MSPTIWNKLQRIDPRILYVIAVLVIAIPLLISQFSLKIIPSKQTIQAYNTIQQAANQPGKIAIIDGWWSASTRGEQMWQTKAILTQLMRDHIPFAILSGDPQNGTLTEGLIRVLNRQYHYVYGVNYVDWGYKVAYVPLLKGIVSDIPGTIKEDYKGTPISNIPVMKGIKNISNVSVFIEITPSGTLDQVLQFVQGVQHTPVVFVPTAVMAPESYPFLDSHQISGIVTGIKGAGDYETLLHAHDFGTRYSSALSMIYALIILLIILGNVGYYAVRRADQTKEARQDR